LERQQRAEERRLDPSLGADDEGRRAAQAEEEKAFNKRLEDDPLLVLGVDKAAVRDEKERIPQKYWPKEKKMEDLYANEQIKAIMDDDWLRNVVKEKQRLLSTRKSACNSSQLETDERNSLRDSIWQSGGASAEHKEH